MIQINNASFVNYVEINQFIKYIIENKTINAVIISVIEKDFLGLSFGDI